MCTRTLELNVGETDSSSNSVEEMSAVLPQNAIINVNVYITISL